MERNIICLMVVFSGWISMCEGRREFYISRKLVKTGTKTQGKIVDIIRKTDAEGAPNYRLVFEYKDQSNSIHRVENNCGSGYTTYRVGDNVNVLYNSDSKIARIHSFWGLYYITVVLLPLGLIFFSLGLLEILTTP